VRAAEPQAQQAPAARDDSDEEPAGIETDEKMGAKKRAKLEAKAEKRAQREADLKSREEQKKRDGEFGMNDRGNSEDSMNFVHSSAG
jgi:hypothetical protein